MHTNRVNRILPGTLLFVALSVGCATLTLSVQSVQAQSAPERIARQGEYLARAGDCISCHTAASGEPFAGGLRMETPFGYMLTPNITPDRETGIGAWSENDFYRALHDGVNRRGRDMYPVMPYDFYTKVSRADVDAIFAYLKSVRPVRNAVSSNHLKFPYGLRTTMAFWRELYFTPRGFSPIAAKSASWNRGAYLVEGLGHCSDCHSPRNRLGAIERNKDFRGALVDGWFALDLTSDISTGLGTWSSEDVVAYLKTGSSPRTSTTLGPMAEVVRNSTSYLSEADLRAMAEYLKAIPAGSRMAAGRSAPDPGRQQGAVLYLDNCGGCHQAHGRGIPGVFPPLAANGVVLAPDAVDILKVVLSGIPAQRGFAPMPAFSVPLNDNDIAKLTNYIRTSWGNTAPPNVTVAAVARLRASLLAADAGLSRPGASAR